MQILDRPKYYGLITWIFHWTSAIVIIFVLILGYIILLLPDSPQRATLVMLNQSTGLCLFPWMMLRLIWVKSNPRVQLPTSMPRYEKYLARFVQNSIYLIVFSLIITGFFMQQELFLFYGLFPVPPFFSGRIAYDFKVVHAILAVTMSILVLAHILGALKQHFINRNDVLKSMLYLKRQ